jgi:hypothetical protein
VVALLQRMGIDPADTRAVKKAALTGAELLLLSEHQLVALLGVPLHRARRMHRLQVRRVVHNLHSRLCPLPVHASPGPCSYVCRLLPLVRAGGCGAV